MSRTSHSEWAKRVQRWADSGLTAKEFDAETALKTSTLSYWKRRLGSTQQAPEAERGLGTGQENALAPCSRRCKSRSDKRRDATCESCWPLTHVSPFSIAYAARGNAVGAG
jgi:hypothetical protein